MAIFGGGVRPELGRTDYSQVAQGGQLAGQMAARGSEMMARGLSSGIQSIAKGIDEMQQMKAQTQAATALGKTLQKYGPGLDLPEQVIGMAQSSVEQLESPDLTPRAKALLAKQMTSLFGGVVQMGIEGAVKREREARQSAAFEAGIGAIPETITQTVEVPTVDTEMLTKGASISAPTLFSVDPPQQSYEDFIKTGTFTPQAPAMAIDMVSKQPAATAAATETPAIKPVPKNIEPYFAFNAQTGSLVPTRKLEQDTLAATSDFQKLEQEKERINSELKLDYAQFDTTGAGRRFGPMRVLPPVALKGEQVQARNQRLAEIEQQQAPLKNKLIELANARQSAADFGKQPDKKPNIEETASNVIDYSLRFAEEVNLDPVDKNQWLQMKTVLKDIPRKATDGEKIAAFVKGYSEIAPIDSGVYFKMKQLFDAAPVITDLGSGNQLITAGNQSFLIRADEGKPMSASDRRLNNQEGYSELLVLASQMGLDTFRAKHQPLYNKLEQLHFLYGDKNSITGSRFTIREVIDSVSAQPANNTATTRTGSSIRSAADRVLEN
jgi:hypothetical protein